MSNLKQKYDEILRRIKAAKDKALAPAGAITDPNDPMGIGRTSGGSGTDAKRKAADELKEEEDRARGITTTATSK